jgi:hypothetical protein
MVSNPDNIIMIGKETSFAETSFENLSLAINPSVAKPGMIFVPSKTSSSLAVYTTTGVVTILFSSVLLVYLFKLMFFVGKKIFAFLWFFMLKRFS